jgi:hypothetical protein
MSLASFPPFGLTPTAVPRGTAAGRLKREVRKKIKLSIFFSYVNKPPK